MAQGEDKPTYIEGAWMTKHGGRYYLQYGAPGTEFNVYANGTYVSDKPLGPFEYADYNPIAYKPGGFVEGAGHGSTFQDVYGNWWNTGTPWIGYNWTFERRINMFPTKFEADGQMWATSRFAGLPAIHAAQEGRRYRQPVHRLDAAVLPQAGDRARRRRASSRPTASPTKIRARSGSRQRTTPATDADRGSRRAKTVRAVQVNYADYKSGRFGDAPDIYTEFELQPSPDGKRWQPLATTGPRRDRPNAYFELPQPVRTRFVRYVHGHIGAANLAISDLRVFGDAGGSAPARRPTSRRCALNHA